MLIQTTAYGVKSLLSLTEKLFSETCKTRRFKFHAFIPWDRVAQTIDPEGKKDPIQIFDGSPKYHAVIVNRKIKVHPDSFKLLVRDTANKIIKSELRIVSSELRKIQGSHQSEQQEKRKQKLVFVPD